MKKKCLTGEGVLHGLPTDEVGLMKKKKMGERTMKTNERCFGQDKVKKMQKNYQFQSFNNPVDMLAASGRMPLLQKIVSKVDKRFQSLVVDRHRNYRI
jgi:hypothetical protein